MKAKNQVYLYNTLTKKVETFKPIKYNSVNVYTCGPTVYWYAHIGNMRAYIFADILKRTLLFNKYKVRHIINITDVGHLSSDSDEGEDKIEKEAEKEHKTAKQIADFYFYEFHKDIKKLNIIEPRLWVKATEYIKEQIKLIQILEKKGFIYKTLDGIYFDSSKFKDYGKLANLNIAKLKGGKRVSLREKKNKTDFALWKFSSSEQKRQQEWNSPWGVGFPGWHIECSAMSMKHLGEHFDIHTGGEDLISVHHTNEIAQSEAATGKKFVNYWMHVSFLVSKGKKVSKSEGGLYTISELEKIGYAPVHFRYLCLLTHYKKPLDFSLENLEAAKKAYEKIRRKVIELRVQSHKGDDSTSEYENEFVKAINDDLNTPLAVQILHRALDDAEFSPKKKINLLEKFDNVLGLGIKDMHKIMTTAPKEVEKLLIAREEARNKKLWAEADILRERIKERGYNIQDTSEGPKLNKIS